MSTWRARYVRGPGRTSEWSGTHLAIHESKCKNLHVIMTSGRYYRNELRAHSPAHGPYRETDPNNLDNSSLGLRLEGMARLRPRRPLARPASSSRATMTTSFRYVTYSLSNQIPEPRRRRRSRPACRRRRARRWSRSGRCGRTTGRPCPLGLRGRPRPRRG